MKRIAVFVFLFGFGCGVPLGYAQPDTEFVEEYSWRFNNFSTFEDLPWTDNLSWDLYRDTYIGIPPTQSAAGSGFDVALYNNVFEQRLTEPGNCFGMILLSYLIQKKGHHLGLCAPVRQYEGDNTGTGVDIDSDPANDDVDGDGSVDTDWTRGPTGSDSTRVRRAINRMHGHQLNVPTLRHLKDIIQQHATRDGNFAFAQAQKYIEKEGATPISVTETLAPQDGGHALLAYDTRTRRDSTGDLFREIFVYDPNRPWPSDSTWYQSGDNVITIEASSGRWEFDMAGQAPWWGEPTGGGAGTLTNFLGASDSNGGNLVVIPASVAAPKARAPGSLGLSASQLASTIAIYGEGASIEGASSPGDSLDNVVPWYPSDATPKGQRYDFGLYVIVGEPAETIDLEVNSGPNGYQLTFAGSSSWVDIQSESNTGTDMLSIKNLGSRRSGLVLQNASDASYRIAFHQQGMTSGFERETRTFILPEFQPPETSVRMAVGGTGQGAFSLQSADVELQYDLQIRHSVGDEVSTMSREDLQLPAGRRQVIQPERWEALQEGKLQIQERQLSKPEQIDINQ